MGGIMDLARVAAPFIGSYFGGPLGGAAATAGVGLLSKDKKNQTVQTQQGGVPEWALPDYKAYLARLNEVTGKPFDPFTGQGVADLTQPSLQGVDLAQQRALNGAPDLNQARGMTMDFTGGKYLDNPYLNNDYTEKVIAGNADQMARSFAEGTAAQNDAGFNRAGAYGGSAWANKQSSDAEGLARQIGSMANQYQLGRTTLGAGDYRSGTGQMLTGGQLAGNLSQDDWQAVNALGQAGNTLQNNQQQKNDFAYAQYLRQQGFPLEMIKALGIGLGPITSAFGNQSLQQPGSNPWMDALGGATAGLGAAGKSWTSPWSWPFGGPGIGSGIGNTWDAGGSGGTAP